MWQSRNSLKLNNRLSDLDIHQVLSITAVKKDSSFINCITSRQESVAIFSPFHALQHSTFTYATFFLEKKFFRAFFFATDEKVSSVMELVLNITFILWVKYLTLHAKYFGSSMLFHAVSQRDVMQYYLVDNKPPTWGGSDVKHHWLLNLVPEIFIEYFKYLWFGSIEGIRWARWTFVSATTKKITENSIKRSAQNK